MMTFAPVDFGLGVLAVSAASLSLAKAHLLEPLRVGLRYRAPWLSKGLGCPWCLSHWLMGGYVWLLWPQLPWLGWGVITLAGVALSGLVMGLLIKLLLLGQAEFNAMHDELIATRRVLESVTTKAEGAAGE